MPSLGSSFLTAYRGPGASGVDSAALETALEGVHARGHAAWPRVVLDPSVLAAYLGERVPEGAAPLEWLGAVRAGDVFLACACAAGAPEALRAFQTAFVDAMDSHLRTLRPTPELVAETKQEMLTKLFVGTRGRPPKIRQYTGQGALAGWVRVAAVRTALNLLEAEKAGKAHADELDEVAHAILPAADPDLDLLRAAYRDGFNAALREAMASLPVRERTLLRLVFVEHVTPARIGALYGVHRTTAVRWIEAAQEEILTRTRARMMALMNLSPSECDSIVALLKSRIDISLGGLLEREP